MAVEIISIGISPLNSYRLTQQEATMLDAAHSRLHAKMADGEFDKIAEDLIEARVSKEENINRIRETREEFGAPIEFEFFRAADPQPASKYYPNLEGTNYVTHYFAKGLHSEFSESIDWIVDDAGNVRIRNYSGSRIAEWAKKTRNREKEIHRLFPHEVRLPAFGYYIEIRY
jgi:hypothetical protein